MGPIKAQHGVSSFAPFAGSMHVALHHCFSLVLSSGFARNTEFSVVTLSANSVTMSLSPNQEQRQGDFPEHTLFIKVPTVTHLCT